MSGEENLALHATLLSTTGPYTPVVNQKASKFNWEDMYEGTRVQSIKFLICHSISM